MADEQIQDEQQQDQPQDAAEVQPEVTEQPEAVEPEAVEASGPAPIDSIHAAAAAIAALNARVDFDLQYGDAISARLDKLEGNNAQA